MINSAYKVCREKLNLFQNYIKVNNLHTCENHVHMGVHTDGFQDIVWQDEEKLGE